MSQKYKVLYDFNAEEDGEMSVRTGEIVVQVAQTTGVDEAPDGWILVEVTEDNEKGFVPIDYLEKIITATVAPSKAINPPSTIVPPPDSGPSSKPAAYQAKPFAATPAAAATPTTAPVAPSATPIVPVSQIKQQIPSEKKSIFASVEPAPPPPPSSSVAEPSSVPPPASAQKAFGAANMFMKAAQKASVPTAAEAAPVASPPAPRAASIAASLNSSSVTTTPFVAPPAAAPLTSTPAGAKTNSFSKLKTAAKTVQNMVHVTSAVSAPRVPSLAAAVDREDFDELVKRNDEYFARLLSSQADTFSSLTDMVDALAKKLTESTQSSGDLVSKLSELDELLDEEKRKWKQQNESEKNADILGRSKELSRALYSNEG